MEGAGSNFTPAWASLKQGSPCSCFLVSHMHGDPECPLLAGGVMQLASAPQGCFLSFPC